MTREQTSPTLAVPDISDVDVAFGARALDWMPPMEEIPAEFRRFPGRTEWHKIASSWFYNGLPANVKFYPRPGVDPEQAVKVIQATLGSFASKHEHKEAAAAYMLSCWFKKVKNWERSRSRSVMPDSVPQEPISHG